MELTPNSREDRSTPVPAPVTHRSALHRRQYDRSFVQPAPSQQHATTADLVRQLEDAVGSESSSESELDYDQLMADMELYGSLDGRDMLRRAKVIISSESSSDTDDQLIADTELGDDQLIADTEHECNDKDDALSRVSNTPLWTRILDIALSKSREHECNERDHAPSRVSSTPLWMRALDIAHSKAALMEGYTFVGSREFKVLIPSSFKSVGRGASGMVYVGHIVNEDLNKRVAVKLLRHMPEGDEQQQLLLRELQALERVSLGVHPNILQFIGIGHINHQIAIVSPYMKNGNLMTYFESQPDVGKIDKQRLILQVASAVNHLHDVEGIVHGDLKCANVLVSDLGDALLADFGLSTVIAKPDSDDTTSTNLRNMYTVRFAAPEIVMDVAGPPGRRRSKTRESDVYAFGMLVLEAVTQRPPWDGINEAEVIRRVNAGLQPALPITLLSRAWRDTCSSCWAFSPAMRPTILVVIAQLAAYDYQLDDDVQSMSS